LEMLRREEGAFGPDDRLKLAHGLRVKLAGGARESQKRFRGMVRSQDEAHVVRPACCSVLGPMLNRCLAASYLFTSNLLKVHHECIVRPRGMSHSVRHVEAADDESGGGNGALSGGGSQCEMRGPSIGVWF
jgi:hypothetical protein